MGRPDRRPTEATRMEHMARNWTTHDERPFATVAESREATQRYLAHTTRRSTVNLIADRIEDTFGPNSCTRLRLQNRETGETFTTACDSKHCHDCGPRKLATMQMQLRTLGDHIWIHRYTDRATIDRALEAAKKRKQRNNEDFTYQIVGDGQRGYLLASDVQLDDDQRYMELSEWMDRIRHGYQYSDDRIRRSRCLGRMSLVPLRVGGQSGTSTPWVYETGEAAGYKLLIGGQLQRHQANMERIDPEWSTTREPVSPLTVLPTPY